MTNLKNGEKIIFQNVAGTTYGIKNTNGIELENGEIIPNECIDNFIKYISRNNKKISIVKNEVLNKGAEE